MKKVLTIKIDNLSKRVKEAIADDIVLTNPENPENRKKTLLHDLDRDLEIADAQKPNDNNERADWINRLVGNEVLSNEEEEKARQVVKKIIETYSQHHTYVISKIIGGGGGWIGDNEDGKFLFNAQPEGVESKKRYYLDGEKIIFEHTTKGVSIKPMRDVRYAGHNLTVTNENEVIVPVEITLRFDIKNPKDTLHVIIKNDIPLSNGKGLIQTMMTEEKPKILTASANLVADKHICAQLIDEYIKHTETGSNATQQKNIKIHIAYNAKAALIGEDISYTTTGGLTSVAFSSTKNERSDEKISAFKAIIQANKEDLSKNTNGKALTAITRLFKRIGALILNKDVSKSKLDSSLGFFKAHGETLVKLVNKKTALPTEAYVANHSR